MFKVYDDFLDRYFVNYVEETILNTDFNWFKPTQGFKSVNKQKDIRQGSQVQNTFIAADKKKKQYGKVITPIKKNLLLIEDLVACITNRMKEDWGDDSDVYHIIRAKANLQLSNGLVSDLDHHNGKHKDFPDEHIVAIYYIHDCDGDTFLWEGDTLHRITPKKGRVLVFDGHEHWHASSCPRKSDYRAILNINLHMLL